MPPTGSRRQTLVNYPAMPRARKINQIPAADRPREKLTAKGAEALSDFELLEVIIGNGSRTTDVSTIARRIQKQLRQGANHLNIDLLTSIRGVGAARGAKILAALELARRHLIRDALPLNNIHDIVERLGDIRDKQQEYLICLTLDGGQRLISQRTITIGTLDTLLAHPREIFADAIADRAASVIVAHNHPSGDTRPSPKDVSLTQQLSAAGQLLGINLRDHLILTKNSYYSFRQHHHL